MTDQKDQLAIINARVWTGNPRRPWADAVLIRGDRIEVIGSSAEVRKRAAPTCRRIDARGMLVVPMWRDARADLDEEALVEAVRLSTQGGSATELNMLAAGAPANLAMFDRDVTRATPDDPGVVRVILLIAVGRLVFDRVGLV